MVKQEERGERLRFGKRVRYSLGERVLSRKDHVVGRCPRSIVTESREMSCRGATVVSAWH